MITKTLTSNDFHDAFNAMRPEQFSYDALEGLFNFFEELSEDTGTPYELDVIGLCCDWCEYDDITDVMQDYPDIESLDDLHTSTSVIELPNEGLLIQQF